MDADGHGKWRASVGARVGLHHGGSRATSHGRSARAVSGWRGELMRIPLARRSYFAFLCGFAPLRELLLSHDRFHAKTQRRKGSQRQESAPSPQAERGRGERLAARGTPFLAAPRLRGGEFRSTFKLLLQTLAAIAIAASLCAAQPPVRDYRRAHERQILAEFTRLLSIPNVASDRVNIRRSAQFIIEMMHRRGLNPRLLETKSKESPPAVYGEWKIPGATRTIVVYAHYDGQPVDPKAWTASPPWQPTWR